MDAVGVPQDVRLLYCYDKQQARPIEELTAAFEQGGTQGLNVACTQELHFTAEEWRAMPEEEKERTLQNYRLAFRADTMVNWCPNWEPCSPTTKCTTGFRYAAAIRSNRNG